MLEPKVTRETDDPEALAQTWDIRCLTCEWRYTEGEDGDGPFAAHDVVPDEAGARYQARYHECEPYMEIKAPGGQWVHIYR